MTTDGLAEHPAGFEFDYSYWFDCECGQRIEVSAAAYFLQCQGDKPYPDCVCGETIDISEVHPVLRDLGDIDCDDAQVDQHLWYHSCTYQDWPSPTYRDDISAQIEQSILPAHQHAEVIEKRNSLALHLGTYAAAIENMLRRMRDQPSDRPYWLHQVQIRLRHSDLAPGIHQELSGWFGDVPLKALTDLDARAARYVNVHEAPGSISLAIDPRVIAQVRTIPLTATTAVHPATDAGVQAVAHAEAELFAAQKLRPDTSGIPDDQVFESELDIIIAEVGDLTVSDAARELTKRLAPQFKEFRDREEEIWSNLRTRLTDVYLPEVTPQLRDRVHDIIPRGLTPGQFHQRLREWAGLIKHANEVVRQFETGSWRTLDPTSCRVPEPG
ncbi:hypothetical protein [Nocardia rhamnosiphila]